MSVLGPILLLAIMPVAGFEPHYVEAKRYYYVSAYLSLTTEERLITSTARETAEKTKNAYLPVVVYEADKLGRTKEQIMSLLGKDLAAYIEDNDAKAHGLTLSSRSRLYEKLISEMMACAILPSVRMLTAE